MYIINSFRALAVILLASILIIKEVPFKPLFKDAMIQFYLALACMLFLLLVDNILGFILSICLLSLYFRIYTSELKNKKASSSVSDDVSRNSKCKCGSGESSGSVSSDCNDKCEMNMAHLDTDKHAKLATAAGAAATAGAADLIASRVIKPRSRAADSLGIATALSVTRSMPRAVSAAFKRASGSSASSLFIFD